MNDLLEKSSNIETKAAAPARPRDRLFGRAVSRAMLLFDAMSAVKSRQAEARGATSIEASHIPRKSIDSPEAPGKHSLEKSRLTVDKLLAKAALEKTFSIAPGDKFRFSNDLSGRVEGKPLTPEELRNRTPMSRPNDLVIFPEQVTLPKPRESKE